MGINRKLRDIFTTAILFVVARAKTTGGFGATPMLPATIEDTYHALHILSLAQKYNAAYEDETAPCTGKNLRAYLSDRSRSLTAGARTTFQMLWCCRTVGLELDRNAVEADVIARMQAYKSLEVWYYGARILTEVLGGKSWPIADKGNLSSVLGRPWRSVDEAWMHMYLSRKFGGALPWPTSELVAWFRAGQNGDGGFGFFPGTTSFVENCHASLRALAFLGAQPLQPDRAFRFLTGCQTASGGFGRSSRAAPFLDSTWHALAALAIMAEKSVSNYLKGNIY